MSLPGNNKEFELTIPQSKDTIEEIRKLKREHIEFYKAAIKKQYEYIYSYQDQEIIDDNQKTIESLILATQDLINNCMEDQFYDGNRDRYFVNLIFICHKMSLRLETYRTESRLKEVSDTQNKLEEKYNKAEERNNNLVYNILAFIASFSVISASVEAISKIENTSNIILFMAFVAFLLLTTLIGLHNFYRSEDHFKTPLQNNYFLWCSMVFVIVVILFWQGTEYIKNNKDEICKKIGEGIGNVIEENRSEASD